MFLELHRHIVGVPASEQQTRARQVFPKLLAQSKIRQWKPGDPIAAVGKRVLLGVAAAYSCHDLALLDVLNESTSFYAVLEAFDLGECRSQEDYDFYIPGSARIPTTPVVGVWQDGVLTLAGGYPESILAASELMGVSRDEVLRDTLKRIVPFQYRGRKHRAWGTK